MTVLPKPARVEKWQRWRDQGAEYVVSEIREGAFDRAYFADGQCCSMYDMRASSYWTFVGYAKPDKVEVGQRWRHLWPHGKIAVHSIVGRRSAYLWCIDGDTVTCVAPNSILESEEWEYLGMAESAQGDWRTATGEALDREAKRNGLERSIGDTDEKLRARFVAPSDPKAEARHANEEAAKRLIANPPEWAYPRAWMCAVLAMAEMGGRGLDVMTPDMQGYDMLQTYHHRRAIQGMTHAEATTRIIGDALKVVDAYARGMERQSPIIGRPGVKGGISTCDLGGEYE